jgi:hypothetical protein
MMPTMLLVHDELHIKVVKGYMICTFLLRVVKSHYQTDVLAKGHRPDVV